MSRSFSVYLDLMRGLAAAVVVYYHYHSHIHGGEGSWFPDIGQEAVMVFFVLSGYIITYVSEQKETSFRQFMLKRAARIYSVLVPSVIVAISCYLLTGPAHASFPATENFENLGGKLFHTLTFTNFNSFQKYVILPGCGPYWSLTYEVGYYILFALIRFFSSRPLAWLLAFSFALFLGPAVMMMFPIWFVGVLLRIIQRKFLERDVSGSLVWLGCLGSLAMIGVLIFSGWRYHLLDASYWLSLPDVKNLLGYGARRIDRWFVPDFTSQFAYFYLVGLMIAVHLFCAARLIKEVPKLSVIMIRRLANSSFMLYLCHLPVMFLLAGYVEGWPSYLMPTLVVVAFMVVAPPIEASKRGYFYVLCRFAGWGKKGSISA